jgi:hypothetical protein
MAASRLFGFVCLVLIVSGSASAQDVTRATFKRYMETTGKERAAARAKKEVDEAARALKGVQGGRFASAAQKRMAVDAANKRLKEANARAKNPAPRLPYLTSEQLKAGEVGVLRRIGQTGNEEKDLMNFEVVQVVDASNVIVKMHSIVGDETWLWLKMPTEGIVDDKTYAAGDRIFEVLGTKRYRTVLGGTKTLFELEEKRLDELVGK